MSFNCVFVLAIAVQWWYLNFGRFREVEAYIQVCCFCINDIAFLLKTMTLMVTYKTVN